MHQHEYTYAVVISNVPVAIGGLTRLGWQRYCVGKNSDAVERVNLENGTLVENIDVFCYLTIQPTRRKWKSRFGIC